MSPRSKNLLSVAADAKTVKGEKLGVMTGILYLAPHDLSGYQVCPKASQGCIKSCLFTAGMGVYSTVQTARINKTKWFFEDRPSFMVTLHEDIAKLVKKAAKANMVPAIRLNGTSDIAWEKIAYEYKGVKHRSVMDAFPDVMFYDYSKVPGRKRALELDNYHLTFSLSEDNDKDAIQALKDGFNVAAVFSLKKKDAKPATWSGYEVIDGDETDVRFKDGPGGKIVALTAKGQARKDTSGFVRSIESTLVA